MYEMSRSKIYGTSCIRLLKSTKSISPNIQGRTKKTQNGWLFRRRKERGDGMSVVLMSVRKILSLWFGRSHLVTGLTSKMRSLLAMPIGSRRGRSNMSRSLVVYAHCTGYQILLGVLLGSNKVSPCPPHYLGSILMSWSPCMSTSRTERKQCLT
jgi:hypothetical protein